LAQLNFDSGLFVVEAFNFVFHLSLISEDWLLSFDILLPFSRVSDSVLVPLDGLHASLYSSANSRLNFLAQYSRVLSAFGSSLTSGSRQIIRRLLNFVSLGHRSFRFFSKFMALRLLVRLSSSMLISIFDAHFWIGCWCLRHMNLVLGILSCSVLLFHGRCSNVSIFILLYLVD
jgi:hypothetical protein